MNCTFRTHDCCYELDGLVADNCRDLSASVGVMSDVDGKAALRIQFNANGVETVAEVCLSPREATALSSALRNAALETLDA